MNDYGDRIPDAGRPIAPLAIFHALRSADDLSPTEVVEAFQAAAALPDLGDFWPELTDAEVREMRRQAASVTKSRLRAWTAKGERQPTWLEIRALISGAHATLA